LLVAVVLLPGSLAWATPIQSAQQGRLHDDVGVPLSGSHELAFSLHDAGVVGEGNDLWAEVHVVDLQGGYYSVVLGQTVDLDDVLFDRPLRLVRASLR